jgi:hypothetical protein
VDEEMVVIPGTTDDEMVVTPGNSFVTVPPVAAGSIVLAALIVVTAL